MKIELSDIISIIALIGTAITYLFHSRKLNTQQKQINEFQIRKSIEEEENRKKALISATAFEMGEGWRVRVSNKGEAIARNIRLYSDDISMEESGIDLWTDIESYPILNKDEYFDMVMSLCEGHNPTPVIKLVWDDPFGKDREYEQSLNLTF